MPGPRPRGAFLACRGTPFRSPFAVRQISLRHLRFFVAVAQTGSFTAAASRLSHTQSSLTSTVQQLEEALGLKLFHRTTRRVEMTEEAVRFKLAAERIIRDFDSALVDMRSIAEGQRGHMSIAAPQSLIVCVLAPALNQFRMQFPRVTISVVDGGSERVEKLVRDGEVDFGLASPLNSFAELDYAPLLADPFGVLYPLDHPLAARAADGIAWEDLRGHESILLTKDTGIGSLLDGHAELGLDRGLYDRASNTTSLFAMLGLGGKISVLPALAAASAPSQRFGFRIVSRPTVTREICLITRQMRPLSSNATRMVDLLRASLHHTDLNGATVIGDAAAPDDLSPA